MKNITILGSTGSIGKNTLDIIRQHPDKFTAGILAINSNISLLSKQVLEFNPESVVIYDKEAFNNFKKNCQIPSIHILNGNDGLIEALKDNKPDVFVNAFVGFAGLEPTIAAIKQKIHIALANKETLVVAGSLIKELAGKYSIDVIPVDSEHSAIWQCLAGESGNNLKRLILTASGGPFRTFSIEKLKYVTPDQALKHPKWKMGPKITIDSATMMNKGLEVIEAFWLYDVAAEDIEVVIHPESIVHSMVEFEDRSIKAQLGIPDMRIPIQYALSYPQRFPLDVLPMDFSKSQQLTFEEPDLEKFPCLGLAYEAIRLGDSYPAVLNAVNEVAVKAFLERRIEFLDISLIIRQFLDQHQSVKCTSFRDYLEIDQKTRAESEQFINQDKI